MKYFGGKEKKGDFSQQPELAPAKVAGPDNGQGRERSLNFFRRMIGNRISRLIMFGFLAFQDLEGQSAADQLKLVKGAEGVEFNLEKDLSTKKIEDFKKRVKEEDPEFYAWVEDCQKHLSEELNKLTAEILEGAEIGSPEDLEQERGYAGAYIPRDELRIFIQKKHAALESVRKNPEIVKDAHEFIRSNLGDIIWSNLLLDDSREIRSLLRETVSPAKLSFKIHDRLELNGLVAGTYAVNLKDKNTLAATGDLASIPKKLSPEILIFPGIFLNRKGEVDPNLYLNALVHEIIHSLQANLAKHDDIEQILRGKEVSGLWPILVEGRTQNITFELMQYLQDKKPDIKPIVGESAYDQRVVLATLIKSILESGREKNLIALYQADLIKEDELIEGFRRVLVKLGLEASIADDLKGYQSSEMIDLEDGGKRTEVSLGGDLKILTSIIAKLRLGNISLSKDLVRDIFIQGRRVNDYIVAHSNKVAETISDVADRKTKSGREVALK
ncbi:MAG: hypothetical protein HYT62_01730 [Candidatus Yanofskybacteria bacterium]|nr:hypothetical protein [Candidatus Yanofskybacteria bacterium]